nr:MAG TPA: hypothetical protein [Caudoviricetes sp.]
MAVTIRDIYAPVLGFGWENLPNRYTKRQYVGIEDGLVTTPSGAVLGTGTLPNGRLALLNDRGTVCAQWWSAKDEMVVVDPFDNQVFVVPSVEDLKCNAREMTSNVVDIEASRPLDLSIMWVDPETRECGFDRDDLSIGEHHHYTDRLNGTVLLSLVEDADGDYVVSRNSALCRLLRYVDGDRFAFSDYHKKAIPGLLNDNKGLSDFARRVLLWADTLADEQREILSK